MSRQGRAWAMPSVSVALLAIGEGMATATSAEGAASIWLAISFMVPVLAFSVIGGLIVSRRPGNVIGWLLAVIGLMFSLVIFCSSAALWGLKTGNVPQNVAEWISVPANAWVVALGLMGTQLLLRLPDGSLPSPRWRWYSRATIILIAVSVIGMAGQRGRVMEVAGTENPLGAAWLEPLAAAFLLVIVGFVVSIAALVLRYRRATSHDRAQLRWVVLSGGAFVAIYIITLLLGSVLDDDTGAEIANTAFSQAAFAALPIGIGFAVLRQNLYDIDVVINRALVYGTLTATLAAVYLGSVLLLQLVLQPVTEGSGLAVAASTLATAALVRPARGRIQDAVDRRFFRRKYDTVQTLQRFSARVRDEVDLDTLTDELRSVVAETIQPAHVRVWVRPPERVR